MRAWCWALIALAAACTPGGGRVVDSADSAVGGPGPDWGLRSLDFLTQGRVCTTRPDRDGARRARELDEAVDPPWDLYQACVTDNDCDEPRFSSCNHAATAVNVADPTVFYPPLDPPPTPVDTGAGDYVLRYVPLCEDGSGDHEDAVHRRGTPPTCAADEWIRCADGTRPIYYTRPGGGDGADDWIVWAGSGGFSLYPHVSGWLHIQRDPGSYSGGAAPPTHLDGLEGVFADDVEGAAFSTWNRVWIDKCTPDRWLGRAVVAQTAEPFECSEVFPDCVGTLDPPLSDPDYAYDVYLHGDRIVDAVLADLAGGVDLYDGYGPRRAEPVSVRPLAEADTVLLSCHSNGCNGMQLSFDRRAERIEALAPGARVRGVFNGFFVASLEGEYAIDETSSHAPVLADRSWYDQVRTGFSIAVDDEGARLPIGGYTYLLGAQREMLDWYEAELDASCMAQHAAAPSPCYDPAHVLANHLGHRFAYNFGQNDSNLSGGTLTSASYCESATRAHLGCGFDRVGVGWQHVIRKQAADLYRLAETHRCEAAAVGPAPYDGVLLWGPRWDSHGSWATDAVANREMILDDGVAVSLRDAVFGWAEGLTHKTLCLEDDPRVDSTATNAALGVPACRAAP